MKVFHGSIPRSWHSTVKHVASVMFTYAHDDGGGIMASVRTISNQAGIDEQGVRRAIRFLREGGYLSETGIYRPRAGIEIPVRRIMLEAMKAARQEEDKAAGRSPDVDQGGADGADDWDADPLSPMNIPPITGDRGGVSPMNIPPITGDTQTESTNQDRGSTSFRTSDHTTESGNTSRKREATATGTRLPTDWTPGDEGRVFAQKLSLDPNRVLEEFRDYWCAQAGAKARKADWLATWRNWCRRDAAQRHRNVSRYPGADDYGGGVRTPL
jgi:hypothetical protein